MSLKLITETLEGVDEALHGLYEQTDSGYRLKVEGVEDVGGLKSALQKERETNKEAKQRLAELEKAREEAEKQILESQGKYKDLSERERKEKLEAQQKLDELTRKVAQKQGDILVKSISAELTTDAVEREIIERFAKDFIEYENDGAKWSKDEAEIKEALSKYVRSKASGTGDAGNNGTSGNSKTISREKFDGMTQSERASFVKSGGKIQ